jgi:hypothetical protein
MNKKFELALKTEKEFFGIKMFRIRALISFSSISEGDLGGYVQKLENIDQSGNAWVSGNARVFDNAWVSGNALVCGEARVFGKAQVSGNARVSGNALVYGEAQVSGNAQVFGDARVSGNAQVQKINHCVNILNLQYAITITPQNIVIGCQIKTHKDWLKTTKKQAIAMGLDAKNYLTFKTLIKLLLKEVKK